MEYGLDYAMHIHDIERLESVEGTEEVNKKIADGWKPLLITNFYHASGVPFPVVYMGVPRPKECSRHLDTIKVYYLRDDDWKCPECLKEQD